MGKMILNGKEYAGSGSEWHEYSTEEKVVGKWIDGKPIYEKSYNVGSIARNTRAEVDSILSIDKIISCNGGAYSQTYNQKYPMPFVHTNTNAYAIMVYIISGVLYAETGNDMPVSECHITVQYTKTTD